MKLRKTCKCKVQSRLTLQLNDSTQKRFHGCCQSGAVVHVARLTDNFCSCGIGVDHSSKRLQASAGLHGESHFANQIAGPFTHDRSTEDFVGLGINPESNKTFGRIICNCAVVVLKCFSITTKLIPFSFRSFSYKPTLAISGLVNVAYGMSRAHLFAIQEESISDDCSSQKVCSVSKFILGTTVSNAVDTRVGRLKFVVYCESVLGVVLHLWQFEIYPRNIGTAPHSDGERCIVLLHRASLLSLFIRIRSLGN
jgi:hypothetical protein